MKKTMKKVLALVLTVLMCVSVAVPVFAADATCPGADKAGEHTKANGKVVSTTPSICGEDGYTVYECNTCHVYFLDDIVLATGQHKYEKEGAIVAATCTADGYKICDVCGHKTKNGDKTGHNLPTTWTLVNNGKDCDAGVVKEERKCTKCSYKETRDRQLAIGDHDWELVSVITAPTCSVAGSGNFKCVTCKLEKVLEIAPTENHKYTVYLNAKPATCTEDGNNAGYACEECGAYQNATMHIPAAHQYQVSQSQTVSCTDPGYVVNYCPVCGDQEAEVTPPLGHDRGAIVEYVAATCVAAGYTTYEKVCSRGCDVVGGTPVTGLTVLENGNAKFAIAMTPNTHNFQLVNHVATCQTVGFTRLECQVEGCTAVDSSSYTKVAEKDPANHEWVETELVAATCTTTGLKTRYCVCGALESEVVIPELGHKYFNVDANGVKTSTKAYRVVLPSCKVGDGYVLWDCMQCTAAAGQTQAQFKDYDVNEENVAGVTGSMKYDATKTAHHDFDLTLGTNGVLGTTAGDCKTVGYNSYFCKDCQKLVSIAIEGTGAHLKPANLPAQYEKQSATCTDKGYAEFWKCARNCGYWEGAQMKDGAYVYENGSSMPKRIEYAALGHKNYVKAKAPTCTEAGYKATWDCDRCNTRSLATDADYVIAALDHNWVANAGKAPVVATVCGTYGYTGYVCNRTGCNADKIADFVYVEHEWSTTVVPATCEEAAYVRCNKNCGTKKYDGEKLGHLDEEGNVVKCATATFTCYREGCTSVDFETTHDFAETRVPATCTAVSYTLYQCKDCTYHKKDDLGLSKLEHNYAANPRPATGESTVTIGGKTWTVTKAPTYTAAGSKYQLCTACGDKKVDNNYVKTDMQITFDVANAKNAKADIVNSGIIAITVKTSSYKLPVWGLELSINFNNQVVEFAGYDVHNAAFKETTKVAAKNVVSDGITTQGYVDRADLVTIAAYAPNGTDGKAQNIEVNGDKVAFVTVYFKVLDGVAPNTDIAFTSNSSLVEVVKKDASEITVSSIGSIASKKVMALGDVNKDADHTAAGYATIQDAIALKLIIEKADGTYNAMADINKDGKVDLTDFGYLMQYIIGEITYNELCAIAVKA